MRPNLFPDLLRSKTSIHNLNSRILCKAILKCGWMEAPYISSQLVIQWWWLKDMETCLHSRIRHSNLNSNRLDLILKLRILIITFMAVHYKTGSQDNFSRARIILNTSSILEAWVPKHCTLNQACKWPTSSKLHIQWWPSKIKAISCNHIEEAQTTPKCNLSHSKWACRRLIKWCLFLLCSINIKVKLSSIRLSQC